MIDASWSNLLTQVPLVGVFVVFVLYIVKIFLEALDKRDAAYEKRNTAVIETMRDGNEIICTKLDIISAEVRKKQTSKGATLAPAPRARTRVKA